MPDNFPLNFPNIETHTLQCFRLAIYYYTRPIGISYAFSLRLPLTTKGGKIWEINKNAKRKLPGKMAATMA